MNNNIPKIIHYCWFGKNPKPPVIVKCIASWKKMYPDWKIIEWNEDNFDVNLCPYTKKAYSNKKWAYVSDVARLKAVYDHGGVYMDTDVELLKPLEPLLSYDAYFFTMKFVNDDGTPRMEVATGYGFGATKQHYFIKLLLDQYLSFPPNKNYEVSNVIDTRIFKSHWVGFVQNEVKRQEYNNMVIAEDAWRYLYHYCLNSWLPWYKKLKNRVVSIIKKGTRK